MRENEAGSSFVGRLVRRQYKPGQKYIQLVFEAQKGKCLALSRNLEMVKTLHVGDTYRIAGVKHQSGDKVFLLEPTAIPLPPVKQSRRLRYAVGGSLAAVLVVTGIIVGSTQMGDEPIHSSAVSQYSNPVVESATDETKDAPVAETAPPPTPQTPSQSTPTTTTTRTTTTTTRPAATTPAVTVPTPAPTQPVEQSPAPTQPTEPVTPPETTPDEPPATPSEEVPSTPPTTPEALQ